MAFEMITRRSFLRVGALAGAALMGGGLLSACSSNEQPAAKADENQAKSGQTQETQQPASQSGAESAQQSAAGTGKVLVAYYSAQGHTKAVAETLADELGTDLFEIVPQQPYSAADLNWNDDNSRVSREHDDESLRDVPLAKATPDNFADYDTVLLGYPIWWGIAAWPTDRFATGNDFSGKRVITFCTSSSSGLGNSGQLLANAAGTGNWEDGKRFSSSASDDEVRTWARQI